MLIEVLVVLMLLATAGTALVTLLGQTAHSMRSTRDSERITRRASADARPTHAARRRRTRRARRTTHLKRLDVAASSPDLFDVQSAESDTSVALLRTTLYRRHTDSTNRATIYRRMKRLGVDVPRGELIQASPIA